MDKQRWREVLKYVLMGIVLIAVAVYILLLVFVASPDFTQLPSP